MTGAKTPVGGSLHSADTRLLSQANKKPWPPAVWRLIATLPHSEISLTHSKHSALAFSNRNKSRLFVLQAFSVFQWLFTLSGTEGRGQSFLIANRILESTATRSKQTVGTISNREKSTALHNRFHDARITNHQSLLTIHGLYDTFLRGAKQNWRNSIYA